jgi:hypothetical protein
MCFWFKNHYKNINTINEFKSVFPCSTSIDFALKTVENLLKDSKGKRCAASIFASLRIGLRKNDRI